MLENRFLFTVLLLLFPETRAIFDFFFPKCLCNCGLTRQSKILGGQPALNEFPWVAYLNIKEKFVPATLINDRYLLTSTSLLLGLTPYDIKVTLGFFDRCTPEITTSNFSVNSIIFHQDYSKTTKPNDLALIRLNSNVNLGKFPTICLQSDSNFDGVATVLGWNNDKRVDPLSFCKPLKLRLPILTFLECVITSPNKQFFTRDKNCLGVIGASSGICKNDAGGPVMTKNKNGNYELIGVLSDENFCGNPPSSAMYTKISPHLEWIKENTKDACYCST